MNRTTLEQHLTQAEERVALGERHIIRQRELVAELDRDGHDTTEAKRLLVIFAELQAMHIAERDELRHDLKVAVSHRQGLEGEGAQNVPGEARGCAC